MEGWICLHRKMLDWEWYTDANTFRLFIHFLLLANHESRKWKGQVIERGQLVTSSVHLAEDLKLSRQQIRTSIDKLKSTNEITIETTNKYMLITIEKYGEYQDVKKENNQQNNQQDNHQITTNNNNNNIYNIYSSSDDERQTDLSSKKDNNTIANSENFDKIWAIYPKKTAKGKAYQFYAKWLSGNRYLDKKITLTNRQIYSAVSKYKQECETENKEKKYILAGSTFFNQRIMDYVVLEE